jgi:hypothetical protein
LTSGTVLSDWHNTCSSVGVTTSRRADYQPKKAGG